MGTGSDCNEYICSNDKDEKQIQEVLGKSVTYSSGKSPTQAVLGDKPLNAGELGKSAWPLLHRMTLSYPEEPTPEQKKKAVNMIKAFAKLYPCKICATDFQ